MEWGRMPVFTVDGFPRDWDLFALTGIVLSVLVCFMVYSRWERKTAPIIILAIGGIGAAIAIIIVIIMVRKKGMS